MVFLGKAHVMSGKAIESPDEFQGPKVAIKIMQLTGRWRSVRNEQLDVDTK